MKKGPDLVKKEQERKKRRQVFTSTFLLLTLIVSSLLIWKLRSLLLPILVGALLGYLFRPLKDRFRVSWLPHELRVLVLFAIVGFSLFLAGHSIRQQMPDERQKLELQVRLKYKLNEKFQQVLGPEGETSQWLGPLKAMIAREAGPAMNQLNGWLNLSKSETELFLKYREGYLGQEPIQDRYFDYFQANQTTAAYIEKPEQRSPSALVPSDTATFSESPEKSATKTSALKEELSVWILAPLIFIFLGFDNGQMRRYFIGLVPNRYFELSLMVVDMLDEAIGRYLRGTILECGLVGLTLAAGMILLGIPVSVAILIGLISGMVNAIPFLGTVFGLIIGLGYALIAEGVVPLIPGLDPNNLALYVIILVGLAHLLDNMVYQPFVLGNAVNLHPLVVIIAIIGGSLLMGILGMLLAIPTVVVVKTAVETLFKELKAYRII